MFLLCTLTMSISACQEDTPANGDNTNQDAKAAYKMSTEFLGEQMSLAATQSTDGNVTFTFEQSDNANINQHWQIETIGNALYRLHNDAFGSEFSLDVVNDGVFDRLTLAPTDNVSGQIWQLTSLDNGFCRLTNDFLGTEIALDVVSDTASPTISMRSVDFVSGQHWDVQNVSETGGIVDGLCSGF